MGFIAIKGPINGLNLKIPGLQIRGGKGYFSIDFFEYSIEN